MYKKPMKPTIISQGLIMDTLITTESVLKRPCVTSIVIGGNGTSSIVMSLENLVATLPEGLESKKRMVALKIFSVILLCMLVLAWRIRICKVRDLRNVQIM